VITKTEQKLSIRPQIRPLNPEKLARITEGAIRGICKLGYGLQMQKVKLRNGKAQLSLPSFMRRELRVVVGSDVVLCRTEEPGKLDMADVSVLDERDVDGKPILGEVVARIKVRRDGRSIVISIKKEAQAELGDVVGKFIMCSLTICPGVVTVKVFETRGVSAGNEETLTEGLWRWPVRVEDAAAAWCIGFEPFREAMAAAILPPPYARRDPRNLARSTAVNQIMIETAEMQAELRRSEQWSISY
jgi:hypothetical protein